MYALIGRQSKLNKLKLIKYACKTSVLKVQRKGSLFLWDGTNPPWNASNNDIVDELDYTLMTSKTKERAQKIFKKLENHSNPLLQEVTDYYESLIYKYKRPRYPLVWDVSM